MRWLDGIACLVSVVIGVAVMEFLVDSYWVGIPVTLILIALYQWLLAPRVHARAKHRQAAYDTSPDGRLTTHH